MNVKIAVVKKNAGYFRRLTVSRFGSPHVLSVYLCLDSEEASQPLSVRQVLTSDNEVVRRARESQSDGSDTIAD
jgi:hypothetical protein